MEDVCNADIQIFKTDQCQKHITSDKNWTNKYCEFITLNDIN